MLHDWSVKKLGDCMTITSCRRVHESEWTSSGVPFYRAREIVALHDKKPIDPLFISEELYERNTRQSGKIQPGDLLVTGVGTIGVQYLVRMGDRFYFKDGNIIWLKHADEINGLFLYYAFDGEFIRKQILHDAGVGTVGTYTIENAKNTRIALPPLLEQEKIADILSCWDDAIEQMQNLIAEKKELKRGLMQRLLTGIQRLPGFTKPWKKIKLSDVLEECTETTTINNQYDILTSSRRGIFKQEDYFDKQVASQDNIGYKIIHNGDFTYRAMTDDDKFCFNQLTDLEIGIVSPAYAVFQTKKIPGNILKFILNSGRFGYELLKEAQGGTRKSLKYNSLIKLQIYVPDDEKEMDKLSDCLFVADSEIDLLNQQLNVLREQKRGLMQKLLTGEIRVKVDKKD